MVELLTIDVGMCICCIGVGICMLCVGISLLINSIRGDL